MEYVLGLFMIGVISLIVMFGWGAKNHPRKPGQSLLRGAVGLVLVFAFSGNPADAKLLPVEVTLSPTSGEGGTINFVYDDVTMEFTEFQIRLPGLAGFEAISLSPTGQSVFGPEPSLAADIFGILTIPANGDNLTLQDEWFTEPINLLIIGPDAGDTFNSGRCPLPRPLAVPGGYSYCTPGAASNNTGEGTFNAAPTPKQVSIDIKPGIDPNSINLSSAGVIPVAILSSDTFDALTVNEEAIFLASAGVKLAGQSEKFACNEEDVNNDGLVDLVCHVETAEFMIEPGEDTAELTAETFDGTPIQGTDSIEIVPD